MREKRIDIFSDDILKFANAICFTSNGIVKKNGALTMGAGVAKIFRDKFSGLDISAGIAVRQNGNVCQEVSFRACRIDNQFFNISVIAFPTKNHWKDSSDIDLIIRSARRLREIIEENQWKLVALPRPGVGLGGLRWEKVREELNKILDNRVMVVYK
jgi:hypothetical protein